MCVFFIFFSKYICFVVFVLSIFCVILVFDVCVCFVFFSRSFGMSDCFSISLFLWGVVCFGWFSWIEQQFFVVFVNVQVAL